MQIGAQYYRPPFPNQCYWEDDLARMADSGLNTVQLWVLWSWVEATPGQFNYDDYDRLVAIADRNGLKVVLSAIAELQPLWIHRIIPGSEMINHLGQKVNSSNRNECHFGITPGGCTDNPAIWERMKRFLETTAARYASTPNLFGWDVWNELRWNVHAHGLVCYCPHTLNAFRGWLDKKYGGLEGLNKTWQRRYATWADVMPGVAPHRPFTEMMAFQHFLTVRANRHAVDRYQVMKAADTQHPVTVHGACPSPHYAGGTWEGGITTPIDRGNDWAFSDKLDGVGCSSFPKWGFWPWTEYASRMEMIRSGAQGKRVWLSELQGGRAASGFSVQLPVTAVEQQQWLFNGLAAGAEAILFWCWRDEVFTTESGGFGIAGHDGNAEARISGFQKTARLLRAHENTIAAYRPDEPAVGILFSPQNHYLHWCCDGSASAAFQGLLGYSKALVRRCTPFTLVEEEHLDALQRVSILFMPRTAALDSSAEDRLVRFVQDGGTLVVEAECAAWSELGLYRYPADRFLKRMGVQDVGRRLMPKAEAEFTATLDGRTLQLGATAWYTPWTAEGETSVWARHDDGILLGATRFGKGRIVMAGTYLGEAYHRNQSPGFEELLDLLCRGAGVEPRVRVVGPAEAAGNVFVRTGVAGERKVVFVFLYEPCAEIEIEFAAGYLKSGALEELVSGKALKNGNPTGALRIKCAVPGERMLVLVEK